MNWVSESRLVMSDGAEDTPGLIHDARGLPDHGWEGR